MITAYVEKGYVKGDIIEINDKIELNHMKNSFRLKKLDKLRVIDGEFEYFTEIIEMSKNEILCKILEKNKDTNENKIEIHGAIGLLKNDKMELVIQKLVEVGVDKIIPLQLQRTIAKVNEKKEKWDIIAKEALKQCQGIKLTEITNPKSLKELGFSDYDLVIVPYENEEEIKIKEVLNKYKKLKKILFIIGSEGGIAEEEINYLKSCGAQIVTLGKRILRAETASIVVGGILINEI